MKCCKVLQTNQRDCIAILAQRIHCYRKAVLYFAHRALSSATMPLVDDETAADLPADSRADENMDEESDATTNEEAEEIQDGGPQAKKTQAKTLGCAGGGATQRCQFSLRRRS